LQAESNRGANGGGMNKGRKWRIKIVVENKIRGEYKKGTNRGGENE
jgi:hypothetical protein